MKYLLLIMVLFFSLQLKAEDKTYENIPCMAEIESKTLYEGFCTLHAEENFQNKDEFNVVVNKDVLCDDESEGCSYFYYAQQHKILGKYYWQVSFNGEKNANHAHWNLGEDFDIEIWFISFGSPQYNQEYPEGVCFFKAEYKFCFAYPRSSK